MCSAWRGQDSRPGGRWVNSDELDYINKKNKDNKNKGLEDGEENLHQMLDNHHKFIRAKARMFPGWGTCHSTSWISRPELSSTYSPTDSMSASSTLYGSEGFRKRFQTREYDHYEDQTEYEIDPITNRKVPKKSSQPSNENTTPADMPVKTFKGYRSQFKDFEPPQPHPRGSEPQPKANATQRPSSERHDGSSHASDARPFQTQSTEADPLAKYDEKIGFNSGRQYDPAVMDIDYSCPVQKGLKDFDEKLSSTAPDNAEGFPPKHVNGQDGLDAYDKKASYQGRQVFASTHDEVEQTDPVQEAIKDYQSSKEVRSSRVIYPEKIDEDKVLTAKRQYEQTAYRKAYMRDQQADRLLKSIRNYEEIMAAERAKGHVIGASGHEHLHPLLRAIREYEASIADKRTDPLEGVARDQTDPLLRAIREYKKLVSHVQTTDQGDARHVVQEAVDPLLNAINEYETFVGRSDRFGRRSTNDSDEDCLKAYDAKVNFYQKPYETAKANLTEGESDSKNTYIQPDFPNPALRWLINRGSIEVSDAVRANETTTPKSWAHLPRKIRELFAKQAESDSDALDGVKNDAAISANDVRAASGMSEMTSAETEEEKVVRRRALEHDFETTQMLESDAKLSAERLRQRELDVKSESDRLRNDAAHIGGIVDTKLGELERESLSEKKPKKMTGNFVRDFPEEFEATWTTANSTSGGLMRKGMSEQEVEADVQGNEQAYIDGMGSKEGFSQQADVDRIQPSLDRAVSRNVELKATGKEFRDTKVDSAQQGEGDLSASVSAYATSAQEEPLKTSGPTIIRPSQKDKNAQREKDRDLIREVRSIYEDTYGTINCKHRQRPSDETAVTGEDSTALGEAKETPQPTVYKILAYDPTMQSISTAETTSIVSDASGPLTPAEVLLRLSNPAKFFPHFQPLQSQGYEIVSGSGDVLVFRKVRDGSPPGLEKSSTSAVMDDKSSLQHRKNIVNPIDGMTRGPIAATGDFASPTGFVNHDIPRGSEPPFKSNIDVRREEPVFSGKRNWEDGDGSGRKKRGLGKTVLIGAGWLGACSYAIGVVADYFKTGGADGLGPKGF
ncbi:hypothetical protein EG329_013830 [Mollisiaceae sp. DMI_Dod_QoI]|nr:hypothetical protein EG329_013830 [Helotiales sp. DMI_Dod_QoI]